MVDLTKVAMRGANICLDSKLINHYLSFHKKR